MTTKEPSMICIMVLGLILMSDVSDAKCTCCGEINDFCCQTKSKGTKDACCVSNGDIRNPEAHDWSKSQCPQIHGNSADKCCSSVQVLGNVPDLDTRIQLHDLFGEYKLSSGDIINGSPVYEHIRGNGFLYKCTDATCSHASWRVHYARPSPIDIPTGRISFNCDVDCPDACADSDRNLWWDTKTEQWVFDDARFELKSTCDVEPTPSCVPNGESTDGCMGCLSCDPKPCCSGCCEYDATPVGPVATRIDRFCVACK